MLKEIITLIFNRYTYVSLSILAFCIATFLVLQDRVFSTIDILGLTVLVIAILLIWSLLVTSQTPVLTDLEKLQAALNNGETPTIIELYSRYCVGCLAVKPVVDQLEREAGSRLQIIRLNVEDEPGLSLVNEYDVVYTPTFLYFDRNGKKLRDSTFVLDRARVLYELDQAESIAS